MKQNQRYRSFHVDINDYKINQQIQNGGFGIVYSVINKKTNKILAAKVLHTKLDENQYKKMINQEIGIMIRCKHPTIIKFYGFSSKDFVDQQNVTIFMEFAEKGSLADYLDKSRKGLSDVLFDNTVRQIILVGIARGMMHLHQNGVIHRDLKPGNILLDKDMRPHITDFGLSKINNNLSSQSQQCGTSIYMAPEVHEGNHYNGKADIYSFGILMYEVVTDSIPYPLFQSGKLSALKFTNKIVYENYRPEFTVPVKKSIKNLIERCWLKNPIERPTFEEIFKKLAYNIEDTFFDIYSEIEKDVNNENDDDDGKYYLDDVNVDEVV
ncbi:hypothetical protein M9Y10_031888 [Tritrichomonas musculus]|uniref:Protein kinase domain-containing protein n=1 Tax=Tritrichomonas musculus TaxID=1915356 RepID=A0ABR2H007_9EUKA